MLIIITTKESNSRTVTKQMPTLNKKPGPDLISKIFPLQFRMLFYFCSFDFLDGGPVSSAGAGLTLSLLLSFWFWDWNFINIIDVRAGKMS